MLSRIQINNDPLPSALARAEINSTTESLQVLRPVRFRGSLAQKNSWAVEARKIAKEHDLPARSAELLAQRGHVHGEELAKFLAPSFSQLPTPARMRGVKAACNIIAETISRGEKVALCGDFDADGICSLAQLALVFRAKGVPYLPLIPCRLTEGYDLKERMVEQAHAFGAKLLIAVDFGTKANRALALANSYGIRTIVCDHHIIQADDPPCPADVLINPWQPKCGFAEGKLVAGGITWFLLRALAKHCGPSFITPEIQKELTILGAIATIADVGILTKENRILAAKGLQLLPKTNLPGLRALCENARISGSVKSDSVGFKIGPLINACGRMYVLGERGEEGPMLGFRLLMTPDEDEAKRLAYEISHINSERKKEETEQIQEGIRLVERRRSLSAGLVLASDRFTRGLSGLVASHLLQRYSRPTMILQPGPGGFLHGSGRSLPHAPIIKLLTENSSYLAKFGGHSVAGGGSLREENLVGFENGFSNSASELLSNQKSPAVLYDFEIQIGDYEENRCQINAELDVLGPTGNGNEPAILCARNLTVLSVIRRNGRDLHVHLREPATRAKETATEFWATWWRQIDHPAITTGAVLGQTADGSGEWLEPNRTRQINIAYRPFAEVAHGQDRIASRVMLVGAEFVR